MIGRTTICMFILFACALIVVLYLWLRPYIFSKYLTLYSDDNLFPVSNRFTYENQVSKGFEHMKNSRAVICALVRDVEPQLDDIIFKVEALISHFGDSKILIVENDSKDKTRDKLLEWRSKNPNVIILGCGTNMPKCSLNLPKTDHSADQARIRKMAYLRNIYLDYIKKYLSGYTYMIVIDLDIIGSFYLDGIANSFYYLSQHKKIEGLCANGIDLLTSCYYDSFPYIEKGNSIEYKTDLEKALHDKYVFQNIDLSKGQKPYNVASCFGGLAIYKIGALSNSKYDYAKKGYACEHSYLNKDINMYVNPSMIYSVIVND